MVVEVSLGYVVLETTEVVGVEDSSIVVVVGKICHFPSIKPTCVEDRRQQHHHPQHQNRHKHHQYH